VRAYKGIIFDLDGTLLDTLEDLQDAVNYTMRQYDFKEKTLEEVRTFVGNGLRRLLELCVPGGLSQPKFDVVVETFMAYYEGHCNIKTRPYDHVKDLLEQLKNQGYQMAIVSNKVDSAVKVLNGLYFQRWITIAIGETKEIKRKPEPDMVWDCLDQMGLKSDEVVYVGDSEVDILTAKNAGMDCISVDWGFRDRAFLTAHGAKQIVSDTADLLGAL
jgi:phosphoglycolate phosphatase